MAEKTKGKMSEKNRNILIIAIVAVIIIVAIIFGVSRSTNWRLAENADDIEIKAKDSDEVKIEKIQAKLDLVNKDIDEVQSRLDKELEKASKLYDELVSAMNEYSTGVPATPEDIAEAEANKNNAEKAKLEAEKNAQMAEEAQKEQEALKAQEEQNNEQ